MKVVKLLTVPGVLLLSVALAIPAFANHATITKLTATCDHSDKICFHIEFTPSDIPTGQTRTITLQLLARLKDSNTFANTGISREVTITSDENGNPQTVDACFDTSKLDVTKFAEFKVKVVPGEDIDLDSSEVTTSSQFECPALQQTPTPTPTASAGTPTATATATTTVALAQTGGFDFRLPLLGLVLLVAGGALFVVSASRGRSAGTK